jgi:hypothetical protein
MPACEFCGREYKSRSGLRRHVKAKHTGAEPTASSWGPAKDAPLAMALEALGVREEDVMSYKVYADKVVVIEGPVGYKRVWLRDAQEVGDGS